MALVNLLIQSAGSLGLFPARPFTTAFLIVGTSRLAYELAQRHPQYQSTIDNAENIMRLGITVPNQETWLISNFVLIVLGVLALCELLLAFDWFNDWVGPFYNDSRRLCAVGSSFAVNYGLVSGEGRLMLDYMNQSTSWLLRHELIGPVAFTSNGMFAIGGGGTLLLAQPQISGSVIDLIMLIWAVLAALGTWFVSGIYTSVVDTIAGLDEDNSLGFRTLLFWAESAWALFGVLLLVIFPLIALVLFALTIVGLFVVQKIFERQIERSLVACPTCNSRIHPSALHCPTCRTAQTYPRKVGLFGQATLNPAPEAALHRMQLIGRKRCPFCATRLKQRTIRQSCQACGKVTFADIAEFNTYLRTLDKKVLPTVAVCFVLGLVPLLGLIPGIIYYRMSLLASLRSYLPTTVGCLTRWGIRLASLFLVMLQSIPLIGMIMLPLLCLLNYTVYRQVLYQISVGSLKRTASDQVPIMGDTRYQ